MPRATLTRSGHQQRPEGLGGARAAMQKTTMDKVKSSSPLEMELELEPRLKRGRGTFYELGLLSQCHTETRKALGCDDPPPPITSPWLLSP